MKYIICFALAAILTTMTNNALAEGLFLEINEEVTLLAQADDVVVDSGDDLFDDDEGFEEDGDEDFIEEAEDTVVEEESPSQQPLETEIAEEPEEEESANDVVVDAAEEESLPVAESKPAPLPVKQHKVIKGAMKSLNRDCNMRSMASLSGDKLRILRKGKKLWVEPHNSKWVKVFRKRGVAFVGSSCF